MNWKIVLGVWLITPCCAVAGWFAVGIISKFVFNTIAELNSMPLEQLYPVIIPIGLIVGLFAGGTLINLGLEESK